MQLPFYHTAKKSRDRSEPRTSDSKDIDVFSLCTIDCKFHKVRDDVLFEF